MSTFATNAFICYATPEYYRQQEQLKQEALDAGFKDIYAFTRENLISTSFYSENKFILDQKRGAGCCLWKPFFIGTLLTYFKVDYVVYVDCGDRLNRGFKTYLESVLSQSGMLLVRNIHKNKYHTNKDCFVLMNCDEPKYWEADMLEAGIVGFVNTPANRAFVEEWLRWCSIPEVVIDTPGTRTNFEGYTNHKCDQSILTNLAIKNNFSTISITDMMKYVAYNFRG